MAERKYGGEFWDQPYYWFTKTILRAVGQWPFQDKTERTIFGTLFHVLYWIQVVPQVLAVIRHYDDVDLIMETLSALLADAAVFGDICTFFFYSEKHVFLLKQVEENWRVFPANNGLHLLQFCSNQGRLWSLLYGACLWSCWSVYVSEPVHTRFYRLFVPSNKTIPLRFAIPVDYVLFDATEYYWLILTLTAISIFMIVTMIIAADALLFLYAQHVCGLFAALGCALENLPVDSTSVEISPEMEAKQLEYVKKCIVLHYRTLHFSSVIDDVFCWSFFVFIGLNMILISMTAVQMVTNLDTVARLVKSLVYSLASTAHLFIQCFLSQRIADSSFRIRENLMNAKWYHSSEKTKHLLKLLTLRSQIPCQLSCGKMVPMTLNTFCTIIRTSATYFTVLRDAQ